MRAVIWTDVMQFCLYIAGSVVAFSSCCTGFHSVGRALCMQRLREEISCAFSIFISA